MSFPVVVEVYEGQFSASLVGAPGVRAVESTRSRAISALTALIRQRMDVGELMALEVEDTGPASLAGKYKDDPTLSEICEHAYRLRDADLDS